MAIENDGLQEMFKTWKPLPQISGAYDKFGEDLTKGYAAFTDNYPRFHESVKKALIDGQIEMEGIAQVVIQVYRRTHEALECDHFFKNEENQFLLLRFLSQSSYRASKESDYEDEITPELYQKYQPLIHFFGSLEEAYKFGKNHIAREVDEIPRHYFI